MSSNVLQEQRKAGQYTPEGLYQKMGAKFSLVNICVRYDLDPEKSHPEHGFCMSSQCG